MPLLPISPLAGKRIVTVEDEGITQLQLKKALTAAGLIVVGQASNGEEGVELILRERPDLVTMDINMPIMDGLEATRQITEQDGPCVVILTSYNDAEHRHRAEEAHACGYALKPITSEALLSALEQGYARRKRR
ncbi:MAG: two-component response regulator [Chthonomonadaceae bacterium]|nr:two-component response regulator [Chthonomonadaceae bacterium]